MARKQCSSVTTAEGGRRGPGRVFRVTYSDARRGSKVADLCDECAGKMPGRAAAAAAAGRAPRPRPERRSRGPLGARKTVAERPGPRPVAALRWEGGAVPPRGACKRGQSRAPARALSGASRRRAGSDRAECVGRRSRRARPARAPRLPLQRRDLTFDRLFELLVRDDPDRRPVATDHQRALIVRRAVGGATLNGLTASARTSGSPTRCSRHSASSSPACSTRRTSTETWPGSTRATAPSSTA